MKNFLNYLLLNIAFISSNSYSMEDQSSIENNSTNEAPKFHPQFPSIEVKKPEEHANLIEKIEKHLERIGALQKDYAEFLQKKLVRLKSDKNRMSPEECYEKHTDIQLKLLFEPVLHKELLGVRNNGERQDVFRRIVKDYEINSRDTIKHIESELLSYDQIKHKLEEDQEELFKKILTNRAIIIKKHLFTGINGSICADTLREDEFKYLGPWGETDQRHYLNKLHCYNKIAKCLIKMGIQVEDIYASLAQTLKLSKEKLKKYQEDPAQYFLDGLIAKKYLHTYNKLGQNIVVIGTFNGKDIVKTISKEDLLATIIEFTKTVYPEHRSKVEEYIRTDGQKVREHRENNPSFEGEESIIEAAKQSQLSVEEVNEIQESFLPEHLKKVIKPKNNNTQRMRANNRAKLAPSKNSAHLKSMQQLPKIEELPKQKDKNFGEKEEVRIESKIVEPKKEIEKLYKQAKISKNEKKTERALLRKKAMYERAITQEIYQNERLIEPQVHERTFQIKAKHMKIIEDIFDNKTKPFTINYERIRTVLAKLGVEILATSSKGDYRKVYYKDETGQELGRDFIYRPATPKVGRHFLATMREILDKFSIKLENIMIK